MKPLRSKRVGPQSGAGDSARSGVRPLVCRIRKDRRLAARASVACTSSARRADDRLVVHQKADRQVPPTVVRGPGELIAGLQRLDARSRKGIRACPLRAGPPVSRGAASGRDCSQCRSGAAFGCAGLVSSGAQGRSARSVAHPTRLETRTKESNTPASRRDLKPEGAMKVKASPSGRGGIPSLGGGRTTAPSRSLCRRGGGGACALGPERW